ncbi:MAG: hypothetical protein AB7P37_18170, partial [Ramlibacter sp.]
MSVTDQAQLTISKVAGSTTVYAGTATTSFVIVVGNAGPSAAQNVTVTDVLPAGVNHVSSGASTGTVSVNGQTVTLAIGSLGANATATLTVVVNFSNATSASAQVTNLASATTTTPAPTPTTPSSSVTVTIVPLADVLTTISLPASATAGQTVVATVTFANLGTSTAANVTGTVVIGTSGGSVTATSYTFTTLGVGQTETRTITFTVPASNVTGTSTITTTTADPNLGNNTATATMTVGVVVTPSLSKTVGSTTIAVGGTTSFTIVIGNAGPSTLTTASIVDSLPANLTAYAVQSAVQGGASVPTAFSLNGTSVSGSVTIPLNGTVSVTINVSATAAGGYTNTVTLTPLSNVTNLGSTTATAPGTV